jgi:hypothetical protein
MLVEWPHLQFLDDLELRRALWAVRTGQAFHDSSFFLSPSSFNLSSLLPLPLPMPQSYCTYLENLILAF